jgi:hypothetical protein
MEYWSHSGICGIGIETLRGFQNQGIASILTTAFLKKVIFLTLFLIGIVGRQIFPPSD